jgi:hypothetical protein
MRSFYNRLVFRAALCEPINAPGARVEEQVGPDQTPGPTGVSLFARFAAPAESERAWGTLGKIVELPRVRGSLNLRLVLWLFRIEIVQPARGAVGVRVIQSSRLIGVVHLVWRTLDLTSKCRASSRKYEHGSQTATTTSRFIPPWLLR